MAPIAFYLIPLAALLFVLAPFPWPSPKPSQPAPLTDRQEQLWRETVSKCKGLDAKPGVEPDFYSRTQSDRFVEGTPSILVKNATIWTGLDDGHEVLKSHDILLANGLVIDVGPNLTTKALALKDAKLETIDAKGAWVTPGIFDIHSHLGDDALPNLSASADTNTVQTPIAPYLRSLDGVNSHDKGYKLSAAGGVTTALVLPGSAGSIGGQAFAMKTGKLHHKYEGWPDMRVLENPLGWNGTVPRLRHMKMACGENPRRVYKQTRMDLAHNFRTIFTRATDLKVKQDAFCEDVLAKEESGETIRNPEFPYELELEAIISVLRGQTKVQNHCYEATDFAQMIRLTHEFKFEIGVFHHAHEAYRVPDLLKTAYGHTPAVAIFASNARYKRESYWGSEAAPKILAENNITVLMKSDHPVLEERYLIFEAQQAHHNGLPWNLAMASVTANSARVAGFGHRLGLLKKGYDSDLVIWDSMPLSLGATPKEVIIDGRPQLGFKADSLDVVVDQKEKPPQATEVQKHVKGLEIDEVVFVNVREMLLSPGDGSKGLQSFSGSVEGSFTVHIRDGEIACIGSYCSLPASASVPVVDLKNGSLLPPIVGYGPALGLLEIISESSTQDNDVFDPLMTGELSQVQQLFGQRVAVQAIDGLEFGGKHLKHAEDAGVTKAITAPTGDGFFRGVSVAFRTGAKHALEEGAILKDVVALHVTIGHYKGSQRPSISTEIANLRGLLLGYLQPLYPTIDEVPDYFVQAALGDLPLVINAWRADAMASIVRLKREVEEKLSPEKPLRWIIHGGQEAHLIAKELAAADISVILSPPRAIPESWDEKRVAPGPPLSENGATILSKAGVNLALGVPEEWQVRTLLWEAAWAARQSYGKISRKQALEWLTTNLEDMFDLESSFEWVAYERDPFEFGSRPVAMSKKSSVKLLG